MLHAKIGPPVLVKKIFEGFLPFMGMAPILFMWPIGSPFLQMLQIKFGFDWPSGFREENLSKCERTDAHTDACTHGCRLEYHPMSFPSAQGS